MTTHQSIEEILTRSFRITFRIWIQLWIPFSILALILSSWSSHVTPLGMEVRALAVLVLIISATFLFSAVTFLAFQIWNKQEPDAPEAIYKRVDLLLFLEIWWLGIRISLTTLALMLLLIIPGLVYLVNRTLAWYILLLHRTTVSEALTRSKSLMTSAPWYSISGPQIRISGLFLCMFLLSIGVGLLSLPAYGLSVLIEFALGKSPLANGIDWIGRGAVTISQQFLQIYQVVALVGFYIDLSNRCQLDLPMDSIPPDSAQ